MTVTVGLPRALTDFTWGTFWRAFFADLGARVVESGPTSRAVLDAGIGEAVSEACVPIKVFHGHVRELASRCDFILVPRMVSVDGRAVFCPKFMGLPDLVRFGMDHLPSLLVPVIDLRRRAETLGELVRLGRVLGRSPGRVLRAAGRAQQALWWERRAARRAGGELGDLLIAVLGYPYLVYDAYLSYSVLDRLRSQAVRVRTLEQFVRPPLALVRRKLGKSLFWHYTGRVVAAGYECISRRCVDGIIHVTAFGCGPDAVADQLLTLESARQGVPYLNLAADEFTGEAGAVTRLEAFIDMLRRNRP